MAQHTVKNFLVKVYDVDGVYLETWASDIVNTPAFTWQMNGGMGEMNLQLKRDLNDFGEGVAVSFGNVVKVYIQDQDQEQGRKIWEGKINRYEPSVGPDNVNLINIVCTSRMLEMNFRLAKLVNDTEVPYASTDPSNILKSLIDMPAAGWILSKGVINLTGTTVSYTFQANTIRDGFDVCVKLAPQYWYFYLDAFNEIHFKVADFTTITHSLTVGKEVSGIRLTKSTEQLINRVFFMGGGNPNLYKTYERTGSQTEWGVKEIFIKDERVTVAATAELIATSYLDNFDHPIAEVEVTVIDNNIDPVNGYDIESLKPGDIVKVIHPDMEVRESLWDVSEWDVDFWDFNVRYVLGQPLQIVEIKYDFNKCTLKLNQKLESFQKRIEDIKRNLEETAKVNIPVVPS